MLKSSIRSQSLALFVLVILAVAQWPFGARAQRPLVNEATRDHTAYGPAEAAPALQDAEAREAFRQGMALLNRNRADQALGYFEAALESFTRASDIAGQATAQEALGDIYARQGLYEIALKYYRGAQDAFRSVKQDSNADQVLGKIGETFHRMGNDGEARAAFAQVKVDQPALAGMAGLLPSLGGGTTATDAAAAVKTSAPGGSEASAAVSSVTKASPSSAATPFCSTLEPDIPNMGHAPPRPDGIGRLDLRVVDEAGNPVENAFARLDSVRPNGFKCDSRCYTNAKGVGVLPPLHVGTLKLTIKAKGFKTATIDLKPEQLAAPLRVVLRAEDPTKLVRKVSPYIQCFNLYQNFINYVTSQAWLGRLEFFNGRLDSALAHFQNLLNASNNTPPISGQQQTRRARVAARTSLGDIALQQGRYDEAIKLYTEAIEGARRDNRLDLIWAAQRGLGRSLWLLAAREKDPQQAFRKRSDALTAYRAALKTIETIFAGGLRADEARTTFLATTKDVFDEASSALAEMALALAPEGTRQLDGQALAFAAEAFKVVEQGRARSLLDLLGESRIEITKDVPPELARRKADNLARQYEIAGILTGINLSGKPASPEPIANLEAELDRLFLEYDKIENQIRTASPRYATLTTTRPLTLAEVQQQVLDDETALVEYNLGPQTSYLWAVTRTGVMIYRLPARAVIEQQVLNLRAKLIPAALQRPLLDLSGQGEAARGLGLGAQAPASDVSAYALAAHTLYRSTVEPAVPVIGGKRLLVVPDGALNFIPFEALVTESSGTSYATLPYLVKTNEVVYAPSASVVAALRKEAGAKSGDAILVVADPVFSANDPRAQKAAAVNQASAGETRGLALLSAVSDVSKTPVSNPAVTVGLPLARLYGTRIEAEQIAQLSRANGRQADLWLDFDASEANVYTRAIDKYRILHFATHGMLDAARPQFTGLVLSLIGRGKEDGFLRVEEVFNLRLGAPFVMLSACETGLGKEKRGEGVMGLTRAFMYAGAPTVGVSLWSVADRSTAELMNDLYPRLLAANTGKPAAALRAAQLKIMADERYSAPFFWAPFVLVGEWR